MPFFKGFRRSPSGGSGSGESNSSLSQVANTFRIYLKSGGSNDNSKKRKPVTRSDTFTLKETPEEPEDNFVNYHTFTRKKGNAVKTDVFDALYQRQSSKSPDLIPFGSGRKSVDNEPKHFDGGTYKKSSKFIPFDKWKQQEKLDDVDKKITFVKRRLSPQIHQKIPTNGIKTNKPEKLQHSSSVKTEKDFKENLDNYATYSKKTFRPDYINPEDNRSLVWFVDVNRPPQIKVSASNPENEGACDRSCIEYSNDNYIDRSITDEPFAMRKEVTRNDTFRINKNQHVPRPELRRSESYSSEYSHSPSPNRKYFTEPIRVEIENPDRSIKVVPVGVAAPYNPSTCNDVPRKRSSIYSARGNPIRIEIGMQDSNIEAFPSPTNNRDSRSRIFLRANDLSPVHNSDTYDRDSSSHLKSISHPKLTETRKQQSTLVTKKPPNDRSSNTKFFHFGSFKKKSPDGPENLISKQNNNGMVKKLISEYANRSSTSTLSENLPSYKKLQENYKQTFSPIDKQKLATTSLTHSKTVSQPVRSTYQFGDHYNLSPRSAHLSGNSGMPHSQRLPAMRTPGTSASPRSRSLYEPKYAPPQPFIMMKGVVIKEVIDGTECDICKDLCPGFEPHGWRKTCQACKCPRDTHAVYHQQLTSVRDRLGFKSESHTSKIDPRQLGYTWVPPGLLTSSKVQKYFDAIPQDKVPKIGSSGERHRDKQLAYQLPKQDLAMAYCKHVESQHRSSYEDFVSARNEIALDIGYVKDASNSTKCIKCTESLSQGELAVIAPKFREQMMWHPRCFQCSACDELLVDLTYCVFEDKLYCERHYAEMLKPRCNACDEGISGNIDSKEDNFNETNRHVSSHELGASLHFGHFSNAQTLPNSFACDRNQDFIIHEQESSMKADYYNNSADNKVKEWLNDQSIKTAEEAVPSLVRSKRHLQLIANSQSDDENVTLEDSPVSLNTQEIGQSLDEVLSETVLELESERRLTERIETLRESIDDVQSSLSSTNDENKIASGIKSDVSDYNDEKIQEFLEYIERLDENESASKDQWLPKNDNNDDHINRKLDDKIEKDKATLSGLKMSDTYTHYENIGQGQNYSEEQLIANADSKSNSEQSNLNVSITYESTVPPEASDAGMDNVFTQFTFPQQSSPIITINDQPNTENFLEHEIGTKRDDFYENVRKYSTQRNVTPVSDDDVTIQFNNFPKNLWESRQETSAHATNYIYFEEENNQNDNQNIDEQNEMAEFGIAEEEEIEDYEDIVTVLRKNVARDDVKYEDGLEFEKSESENYGIMVEASNNSLPAESQDKSETTLEDISPLNEDGEQDNEITCDEMDDNTWDEDDKISLKNESNKESVENTNEPMTFEHEKGPQSDEMKVKELMEVKAEVRMEVSTGSFPAKSRREKYGFPIANKGTIKDDPLDDYLLREHVIKRKIRHLNTKLNKQTGHKGGILISLPSLDLEERIDLSKQDEINEKITRFPKFNKKKSFNDGSFPKTTNTDDEDDNIKDSLKLSACKRDQTIPGVSRLLEVVQERALQGQPSPRRFVDSVLSSTKYKIDHLGGKNEEAIGESAASSSMTQSQGQRRSSKSSRNSRRRKNNQKIADGNDPMIDLIKDSMFPY